MEQLSEQYSSGFIKPRAAWAVRSPTDFFGNDFTGGTVNVFDFYVKDIEKACGQFKSDSAPGPDRIPVELLKTARLELSQPLYIIRQASLDQGSIPDLLLVQVCPLHKGGSRSVAKTYRPVALTSHVTNVFERVVRTVLVSYLESHGHLPEGQHGFRTGPSCLTQLLAFWDNLP